MKFNSFEDLKVLFEWDLISLLDEVFTQSDVQDEMIEFNQDQLQDGTDALGQKIKTIGGSPYRPFTVIVKKAKGQPTNKVTLFDTGEFYQTFKVRLVKDGYEIIADFQKPDGDIRDNFSNQYDFLGLDDESLTELVMEAIYPRLSKLLKEQLDI